MSSGILARGRNTGRAVVLGVLFYLWSTPALAQKLVFTPTCGQPGVTKVCVTGSGWAEPSPPCFYRFYFDGAQVVFPDQPDGLFGPPLRSFTVPPGAAAGDHSIKVDLRITSNNKLLQSKQTGDLFFDFTFPFIHAIPSFKVVNQSADPFMPAPFPTGNRFTIAFDSTNVCEVGTCSKIGFIQVGKITGQKGDGTSQTLKVSELRGFPAGVAAEYDTNTSATGFFLDKYGAAGGTPYPNAIAQFGRNDQQPIVVAILSDPPNLPGGPTAAGFVKLMVDFETAVFCISGPDKGRFYGVVKWKYETNVFNGGSLNQSTFISADKNAQPSGNFTGALNAWLANPKHTSFKLPSTGFPRCP